MTTEELLNPRYEVIANYPGNNAPIGFIYETKKPGYFDQWPDVFRKLKWWEHRKPEDMPEYLKLKESGTIIKIISWQYDEDVKNLYCQYENDPKGDLGIYPYMYLPATKAEYTHYINSKS